MDFLLQGAVFKDDALYWRGWLCQLGGKKKKKHNLKVENYVYLADKTEDLSLGRSLSALRNCPEEVRKEPIGNHQKIIVN